MILAESQRFGSRLFEAYATYEDYPIHQAKNQKTDCHSRACTYEKNINRKLELRYIKFSGLDISKTLENKKE